MSKEENNIISFENLRKQKRFPIQEEGSITISVLKTNLAKEPFFYIEPDRVELLPIVDFLEETLSNYSDKA